MTRAQKIGFFTAGVINAVLFAEMNFRSWEKESLEFEFSQFDHKGYSWGWPFEMYNYYLGYPSNDIGFGPGLIFNILAFVLGVALFGMVIVEVLERLTRIRNKIH